MPETPTPVLASLLGTENRRVTRAATRVLFPACAAVLASFALAQATDDRTLKKICDNVHWTISYGAAALLAWMGVRAAPPAEAAFRKCFAWALTLYVMGQVLWDLQVGLGWNPFPGPSDLFFSMLGPLTGLGFVGLLRQGASPGARRTAALDVAGLSAAVLALTLALYLPRGGDQPLLPMVVLVAYPVFLSWAACMALITALVLRLRPRRGLVLFLLGLIGNFGLWLRWNELTLDDALADGTLYNALFSAMALTQGTGALLLHVETSTSRSWERFCEGFLRLLPLAIVVLSAAAVSFAYALPQVPAAVKWSALAGALVVVILASVRQSVMLREHERLIEAERELRVTERRYRAALDLIPIPVCITTHPQGVLIELNHAFTQYFALPAAEALGRKPSELGLWARIADRDAFVARLLRTGRVFGFETLWVSQDGTERPSLLTGAVTELEGVPHCVLVINDISALKRAEAALRQSEEKYREVVEQAAEGIFIADRDGKFVDVNPRGSEMLRMTREEVIGLTVADIVSDDDRSDVPASLRALHAGQTMRREGRFKRKDGSLVWVDVTAKMLHDGRLQGMARDISERKRAEEERAALEGQLRQSQKLEAVGSLAAGIAHDFNNILTAIRGNAELAADDVGDGHPALESLEEIRTAGSRGAQLVQQILAFSRPRKPSSELVRLPPLVDEVVRLLRSTLPAVVEMKTSFEADTPPVMADPNQIHQVLVNLCTNAWQAMEGQAGKIEIALSRRTIDEASPLGVPPGEYACIAVRDTGKGMPPETSERVFEPFFTTKPLGKGTGLGLSVVFNIITSHHGAVAVDSSPGLGSTFQVYLPATASDEHGTEAPSKHPRSNGAGRRVLYVDDEQALVSLVTRLLERQGYRVFGFDSPDVALRAITSNPRDYDVFVTDYNMPRMTGIDFIQEVLKVRADAPFIVTSGFIDDQIRAAAERLGVRHLIHKPDTVDELCESIDRITRELP